MKVRSKYNGRCSGKAGREADTIKYIVCLSDNVLGTLENLLREKGIVSTHEASEGNDRSTRN